ncbi:unnamed protein product [Ceutorhynchus assimilis]|uniref:Ubiquitin-conjugating enzyme E2 T n=1 Tax=Ceutorhynchus assimilis TaxID=467358 RepID=A0A9N9MG85_9CUCU|nr:unnamed protein product [Ceutorhynchus assimilis]
MLRNSRMARELANLSDSDNKTISLVAKNDSLGELEAQITGPEGTPYENGVFKLEVLVPQNYPFEPPSIKFLTKIYHPNIDDSGRVCMDLVKMPPKGNWRPTIGLESLLISIRLLLESPNPDDPLMADIATEFKRNHSEYVRKAKEYTQKYAKCVS